MSIMSKLSEILPVLPVIRESTSIHKLSAVSISPFFAANVSMHTDNNLSQLEITTALLNTVFLDTTAGNMNHELPATLSVIDNAASLYNRKERISFALHCFKTEYYECITMRCPHI